MRPVAAGAALVLALLLAGCAGHGCGPMGGIVSWRQPGAAEAVLAAHEGRPGSVVERAGPGIGVPLPAGTRMEEAVGNGSLVHRVDWTGRSGTASIAWAPDGAHLYVLTDEERVEAARVLVHLVAANASEAEAWLAEHPGGQGGPLGIALDLARALDGSADGRVVAAGGGDVVVEDGNLTWGFQVPRTSVHVEGVGSIDLLPGGRVAVPIQENPEDVEDAVRLGAEAAAKVGVPAGQRSAPSFREQVVCG